MDNEDIEKLFEELNGKVDLGMGEEALAICETILNANKPCLPPFYLWTLL